MNSTPDERESDPSTPKSEEDRARSKRRSTPAVVGPADVADEVKEVLKAAFEGSQVRNNEARARPDEPLDTTGPLDVLDHASTESASEEGSRRGFLDIAREHDARLKSGQSVTASPAKAEPVAKKSKSRVVITDEEVENIKKTAPREDAKTRRKKREGSPEVTRLPNRRWWTRTAGGGWRLRWYSIVAIAVTGIVLVLLLLTSPLLSIRSVVVEGNVYTNQAQLDQILGQIKGDAILTADLHGAARQIEAMPWVRKARVSMRLPSRVLVQIDERRPAAFYRAVDGFIRVIDREGRILDVIEGDPIDYVRIIGTGPNLAPGDFVGQPFKGAVSLAEALPASLADRLVSVTTSPEGEISVQLSPNLLIIFGQPADFQVKLVAVINEMKRQGTRSYTVIDVSTGEPNVR